MYLKQSAENGEGYDIAELEANSFRVGVPQWIKLNCETLGEGVPEVTCQPEECADIEMSPVDQEHAYWCQIVPKIVGEHTLSLQHEGEHIHGSPLQVQFSPRGDAFKCHLVETTPQCQKEASLTNGIQQEDNTPNAGKVLYCVSTKGAGTGTLTALVKSNSTKKNIPTTITKSRDDHFHIEFFPSEGTKYIMSLWYDQQHIHGSPFRVIVSDASQCRLERETLVIAKANQENKFSVYDDGAGFGELTAVVKRQGGEALETNITAKTETHFEVSYFPSLVGSYTISVFWDGDDIPGSPFTVHCCKPDPEKCTVTSVEVPQDLRKPAVILLDASKTNNNWELDAQAVGGKTGRPKVEIEKKEGRKFAIRLQPSAPDYYNLTITWGGKPIPESPLRLNLNHPNAKEVVVADHPASSLRAGQAVKIGFDTSKAGRGTLTATCKSKTVSIPVNVAQRQTNRNIYDVTFVPPEGDIYHLKLKWADKPIKGSPYEIDLRPIDAHKVKVMGPNMPKGIQGPVEMSIISEDAGNAHVTAKCIGSKVGQVPLNLKKISRGNYNLSFHPPKPDIYTLSVKYGGQHVLQSPFYINTMPTDPTKVKVTAPKTIQLHQLLHYKCNVLQAGNGNLTATCQQEKPGNTETIKVNVSQEGPAKYDVSFTLEQAGIYTLSIQWSDREVPGSPFALNLAPQADKVKVGELHVPNEAGTGENVWLEVDCSEARNGKVSGEAIGSALDGLPEVLVEDKGNDLYQLSFHPQNSNVYIFSVYYGGQHVHGSPFSVDLHSSHANRVKYTNTSVPEEAEDPVELSFDTSKAGKGELTAQITSKLSGTLPASITESLPNEYKVSFTPPHQDVYQVYVFWANEEVNGSPFHINLLPPDASKIIVTEPESYELLQPVHYKIDAFNAGNGTLVPICKGEKYGDVAAVWFNITKEGTAQYDLSFTPHHPDMYKVSIQWSGKEVPGSPFKVNLLPAEASKVKVTDVHIPEEAGSGDLVWVDLDCSEAGHGVLMAEGKGSLTGSILVQVDKVDRDNYKVTFQPDQPEIYSLSIYYGESHIPTSPLSINLIPPQPNLVKHTGTSISRKPGGSVELSFDTSKAGKGELTAQITSKLSSTVLAEVIESPPNEFKVLFTPPHQGVYQVHVFWANEKVNGSPFRINLLPPDASKIIVTEPESYELLQPVHYKIDAFNAGNGALAAICKGDTIAIVQLSIFEESTAVYDLSFTPHHPDMYNLSIQWSGKRVPGSPFKVNLLPAEASIVKVTDVHIPEEAGSGDLVWVDLDCSEAGHGVLMAEGKGSLTGSILVQVDKVDRDNYKVTFQPDQPEIYSLSIYYGESHIPTSPLSINLLPPQPNLVKHTGTSIPEGHGGPIELFFNTANAGKGKLTVQNTGLSSGPVPALIEEISPNEFKVSFTPPHQDVYQVYVFWANEDITGSPFHINLLPLDANKTIVTEPESYELLQPVHYKVNAFNAGNGALAVICKGEAYGDVDVPLNLTEESTAVYDVMFTPHHPDMYKVSIQWSGKEVPGSPFKVNLLPAEASKVKVTDVHIPEEAGSGDLVWVDLDCSEAGHGVLMAEGKGSLTGSILVQVDKVDRDNYKVTFQPDQPEIYSLSIYYGESHIPTSPLSINLIPPQPNLVKHTGTIMPTEQGGPAVLSFDTSAAGRGSLTAHVTGELAGGQATTLTEISPHSYEIGFIPTRPDAYNMDVFWAEKSIKGSPFTIKLVDPSRVECGAPSFTTSGKPVELEVNTLMAGPGVLTAECSGEKCGQTSVKITSTTTYSSTISFKPTREDVYHLSVYFEGSEVNASPFKIDLVPRVMVGEDTIEMHHIECQEESLFIPPEFLQMEGEAESDNGDKGEPELTIYVGEPITLVVSGEVELSTIVASVTGERTGSGEVKLSQNPDNSLEICFDPDKPDHYILEVECNGEPVPQSPYLFHYIMPVDPSRCQIIGLQDIPASPQINVPISLGVDATMAGDGMLKVTVEGPSQKGKRSKVIVKSDEENPQIYNISFLPRASGIYTLHLLWANTPIPGSPVKFDLGGGYTAKTYLLGRPFIVVINASCNLTDFQSYATHKQSGTQCEIKMVEIVQGKFELRFSPQIPGTYAIHVSLGGEEIPGCPYTVIFVTPANEKACKVNMPDCKAYIGEVFSFTVDVTDAGMGELFVQSSVPPGGKDSTLTVTELEQGGSYKVEYIPNITGVHNVVVMWGGKPVPGCPFEIPVLDLYEPDIKHSLKGNSATNLVEVGQQININVTQPKFTTEDNFLLACCTGKNSGEVQLTSETNEKSQTLCFSPSIPDDYTLELTVKNEQIEGSPFFIKAVEKDSLTDHYKQANAVPAGKMVNLIASLDEAQTHSDLKAMTYGPMKACKTFIRRETDGTHCINFFPNALGVYLVHIKKDDSEIPGSPLMVIADSAASKVFIVEDQKDKNIFQTLLPLQGAASFRISAADAGPGRLDINAKGPGKLEVQIYDNNDGTYTCKLAPTIAGKYHISILWDNVHIKGSPFTVNFTSGMLYMITGLSLQQKKFYIGVPHNFKVDYGDQKGFLDVACRPANAAKINITPKAGSNLYECDIIPQLSGHHEIAVQFDGKHILGSPFSVQFDLRGHYSSSVSFEADTMSSASENVKAYGSGLEDGIVGQEGNFVIETEEAEAGSGPLLVQVHGPKGAFKINMRHHPENERTILVRYDPNLAGLYTVDITWSETHIPGSPFKVNITEQTTSRKSLQLMD